LAFEAWSVPSVGAGVRLDYDPLRLDGHVKHQIERLVAGL